MAPKTLGQMTAKELLAEYNRLEEMLYGAEHRQIPEGAFDKIEGWIEAKGYRLISPKSGLSTIKKASNK